jgi:drug/metabolite transporter (DMT)-like permease
VGIIRIIAIVMIIAGTLGLVYGGIKYTGAGHKGTLGPVTVIFKDRESVTIPVWASAGAIAAGALLLLARRRSDHS